MRPAHCAREVEPRCWWREVQSSGFNEARALCAGSSAEAFAEFDHRDRFNEARALCAGSFPRNTASFPAPRKLQ